MSVNQIIDQVLTNMLQSDNQDFRLAKQQSILELIERDELLVMERLWPTRKINMVEFIKIMVSVVHHKQCELLYLVMGLIELYKDIVAACQQNELSLADVTSFVCQVESAQNNMIPQFLIPEPKKFTLNKTRIRDIDVDAPKIIGQSDDEICHIVPNSLFNDSIRHHNGTVHTGVYCNKKIITLDSLDSKLNVYNLDGSLKQQLKISQNEDRETIILSFAWSDRQQRIGMTLKSHSMCMYEGDYRNYRIFSTVLASSEYQSNIWFLENQCKWLTTDSTFKLYEWDLQAEQVIQVYSNKVITGNIIECVEVVHMKMIATASLDKQIVVWDLNTKDVKITVSLKDQGGIHSLVYSYYYQVFITCGYSTNISLFEINPKFHDVTAIGKLSGHTSMLTSIQIIGKSPVLISGDDQGSIRLWDIRNFACIQSLNFGKKTQITKLLDISDHQLICFLGSRVNLLKLDQRQGDKFDNFVLKVEFDQQRDELIVSSKKNIIYLDIHTGRMKRILNGLLADLEDEITQFRPLNYFNKFILCDSKGQIKIYYHSGEFISSLKGHQDIMVLKLDILNKLIITAGQDQITIQKMNTEIMREIVPFKASNLEISVHHSLLIASQNNLVYIFDYEFVKVLNILEFDSEVTAIIFIANYPLFAVATVNGKVYFLHFTVKDHVEVTSTLNSIYDTGSNNFITEDGEQEFITKMVLSVKELEMAFSTSEGNIIRLQLNLENLTPSPAMHERINYNPLRKIKEQPIGPENKKIIADDRPSLLNLHMFPASKKMIMSLNYLLLDTRMIIISSIEGMIKIFDLSGNLVAALNINHPLPVKWDITYTKASELRKQIIYGFKVIDILRKQSKTEKEAEIYSLNDSISIGKQLSLKSPRQNRAIIMKDEYSPRDLKYDKIRHLYQNEVQGPTLKQMEAQRRLIEVQNMFKNDERDPHLDEVMKQKEKERQKNIDRQSNLNFLDPDYRDRHQLSQKAINGNRYLQEFNIRLDKSNEHLQQKSIPQLSLQQVQNQNKSIINKKKSVSDFYEYAHQKNLLYEQSNLDSFASRSTLKNTNILSQQQNSQITYDQTWQGKHRKQQRDLSQVLSSLNIKLKNSRNSQGEMGDLLLNNITKSDITFEDQLDEFTKKHPLK